MIERFVNAIKHIVNIDAPANKIALSSGLGMVIGFSPYLGFHTILATIFSVGLRLPIYPLMIGAYITNPITIPPIYAFLYKVGVVLTDSSKKDIKWDIHNFSELMVLAKSILWPLFVGCHVFGLLTGLVTYFVVKYLLIKYRGY
ncbi:DUF2062 domain-containing protein [Calditerrivibrio sp.]|jgi:uncharacterized protein (DUF2062 family)|uniref:DUF2062 domain-containing protein n=1 Tax=Calditerrivibrio nitroreducens TaxID=477976 RepID=A0A2J6WGA3_9BACT|nr:MAG: DUF2062 domain-containing protein [Calditerrivibrio nitroreducens]